MLTCGCKDTKLKHTLIDGKHKYTYCEEHEYIYYEKYYTKKFSDLLCDMTKRTSVKVSDWIDDMALDGHSIRNIYYFLECYRKEIEESMRTNKEFYLYDLRKESNKANVRTYILRYIELYIDNKPITYGNEVNMDLYGYQFKETNYKRSSKPRRSLAELERILNE